jgi:UDP-glucuronate 4-epimerase
MLPAVPAPAAALVTGARGFVGSAVVQRLRRDGCRVTGVDLPPFTRASSGVGWFMHDLVRPLPTELLADVELVIHAAALAGVHASWARPLDYWRANVIATELLREACERAGSPRVIHLSSISVYGEGRELEETAPARPLSPYGVSKLAGERAWPGYGGAATVVRLSNVYGPGQRPDMAYATFLRAAQAGEPVMLRDAGRQLRTPTYIDDCVNGILAAASVAGGGGSVYNIAGPEDVRLHEAVRLIERLLGRPLPAVAAPRAPGDPRCATVSSARAAHELGYRPRVSLSEGLERQLQAAHSELDPAALTSRVATA